MRKIMKCDAWDYQGVDLLAQEVPSRPVLLSKSKQST